MAIPRMTTLANGLKVVSLRIPGSETMAVGCTLPVGSCHDPEDLGGLAHFVEHTVFRGTENRTRAEIWRDVEHFGAELNAQTDKECTSYFVTGKSRHLGRALDVLSDLVLRPVFPRGEIEPERRVILQELRERKENPSDHAVDLHDQAAYGRTPLGRPIIGRASSVRRIRRRDLIRHVRRHYVADGAVIVAAGRVNHARLVRLADEYFGAMPRGTREPPPAEAGWKSGIVVDGKALTNGAFALGLPAPAASSEETATYRLLAEAFGGGSDSPLLRVIREREGLCYSASVDTSFRSDGGEFIVTADVSPFQIRRALQLAGEQLRAFLETLPEDDVARARNKLKVSLLDRVALPKDAIESIATDVLLEGRPISVREHLARIERVTRKRLRETADRLLSEYRPALAVVGTDRNVDWDRVIATSFG